VIRIPKPDTIQAYLYCDKLRRATLHKYIGTFEVMLPMLPANEGDPAVGGEHGRSFFSANSPARSATGALKPARHRRSMVMETRSYEEPADHRGVGGSASKTRCQDISAVRAANDTCYQLSKRCVDMYDNLYWESSGA